MIVSACNFNPVRDRSDVDQFGFVDLASILRENVAPSVDADGNLVGYDGVDDPHAIAGRPDDVFASFRMRSAIEQAVKDKKSAAKPDEAS